MVPWRLDSNGKPPNIEVAMVVEVEAAIGAVLGPGQQHQQRDTGDW